MTPTDAFPAREGAMPPARECGLYPDYYDSSDAISDQIPWWSNVAAIFAEVL